MTGVAAPEFALVVGMALAGLGLGTLYFAALRRSVEALCAGRGRTVAIALTLGRYCVAALVLALVARLGAAGLLATFGGFLAARVLALRASRERA